MHNVACTIMYIEKQKLDGVLGTQTSRLLLSYHLCSLTTAIEATALFVQQHVKGAIIVYHVTPPHGEKKRLL